MKKKSIILLSMALIGAAGAHAFLGNETHYAQAAQTMWDASKLTPDKQLSKNTNFATVDGVVFDNGGKGTTPIAVNTNLTEEDNPKGFTHILQPSGNTDSVTNAALVITGASDKDNYVTVWFTISDSGYKDYAKGGKTYASKSVIVDSEDTEVESKTYDQYKIDSVGVYAFEFEAKASTKYTLYSDAGRMMTYGFAVGLEGEFVPVDGISLNKQELTLDVGAEETLTATVSPEEATDKKVTWESDNEDVATVDKDGKVLALKAGTAHITAKAGDYSATCTVTVNETILVNLSGRVVLGNEFVVINTLNGRTFDVLLGGAVFATATISVANGVATYALDNQLPANATFTVKEAWEDLDFEDTAMEIVTAEEDLSMNVTVVAPSKMAKTYEWETTNGFVAGDNGNGLYALEKMDYKTGNGGYVQGTNNPSVSNGIPSSGAALKFVAAQDGTLDIKVFFNGTKTNYVYSDDGTKLAEYTGSGENEDYDFSVEVEAGKTYYAYASGSKIMIKSIKFTAAPTVLAGLQVSKSDERNDLRLIGGITDKVALEDVEEFGFEITNGVQTVRRYTHVALTALMVNGEQVSAEEFGCAYIFAYVLEGVTEENAESFHFRAYVKLADTTVYSSVGYIASSLAD